MNPQNIMVSKRNQTEYIYTYIYTYIYIWYDSTHTQLEKYGKKSNVTVNAKFRLMVTSLVEAHDQNGSTVAFWNMITVL